MSSKNYCRKVWTTDHNHSHPDTEFSYYRINTNQYHLMFLNWDAPSSLEYDEFSRDPITVRERQLVFPILTPRLFKLRGSEGSQTRLTSKISGSSIEIWGYSKLNNHYMEAILQSRNRNRELWNLEVGLGHEFGIRDMPPPDSLHSITPSAHFFLDTRLVGIG